jgi:hypothetical protein
MATHSIGLAKRLSRCLVVAVTLASTLASVLTTSFLGSACAIEPSDEVLQPSDEGTTLTRYKLLMMQRPELATQQTEKRHMEGLLPLWQKALDRPDAELQRMTIDTLAIAHRRGVPGIEKAKERLIELASAPDQDMDVVLSATQALIAIEAKDCTSVLTDIVKRHGDTAAKIVEPAIAKWKSKIMLDRWIKRVEENSANEGLMLLAIDGLAAVAADEADESLYALVQDSSASVSTRLHAATAISTFETKDASARAEELLASTPSAANSFVPPLLAVAILGSDNSDRACELLTQVTKHGNSLVQSKALNRLFEIDPANVDRLADDLIASSDVNVRRTCVRGMLHEPNSEQVRSLALVLNDINPALRCETTAGLLDWAKDAELREEIIGQTMRVLHEDSWQGCEQAIVLLTKLAHKPAGSRIVDLLGYPRDEVKVASAWALVQLRDQTHLSAMLQHAESVHEILKGSQSGGPPPGLVLQVAHLFNAFGDQKYAPAETLLRAFLPKNFGLGTESRAAACWAISMLSEDDPPKDIEKVLTERFNDVNGFEPEEDLFRSMCAIGFGRMKTKTSLPLLRDSADESSRVSMACKWSIEQMTGEKSPPEPIRFYTDDEWFLKPVVDQPK